MFFKSLGITIQTTYSEDWTYVWKDFYSSITLIVCGKDKSDTNVETISDNVFYAFGLFIRRDEFCHPSIVEKIKREAKHFMPIVDQILESSDNDLYGLTDCVLAMENLQVLNRLKEFSVQCGSLFCCVVVNQKTVVGTEGWWDLHVTDRYLLITLLNSSNSLQNDVAVYLPKKSPDVIKFIIL